MQRNIKKLDQKIHQISLTYKQLKQAEFYIVKKTLIASLKKMCCQALMIIDNERVSTQNIRKRKQIDDMMKRCSQIQNKIELAQNINPSIGKGSRFRQMETSSSKGHQTNENSKYNYKHKKQQGMTYEDLMQKSRAVVKSIIFYEIQSKDMRVSPSQIDRLAERFQTNHAVMKDIQLMVVEQGGNVDEIQNNIKKTYEMAKQANIDIQEAAKIQHQTRLLKIRLGVTGFLGAIGLKLLGIPGLILGIFGGMISTK